MRRAAPHLLFGGITLLVFWKFLLLGHTLLEVNLVERHLGIETQPAPTWFRSNQLHGRISDAVMLLPAHHRVYSNGLKEGELRLWNPSFFCGTPVYANPMVHPFYPPHLVLHTLFPARTAYALSLMLHFFFSGVCMFVALRTLGRGRAASAAGGAAWMLFGYNAIWFSSSTLVGISIWAPLALKWIVEGLERRDLSRSVPAAMAMGMMILGSHPQHALHFFLFFLAWILAAGVRNREDRTRTARFGALFAGLSVGLGLAAVATRLETIVHGFRKSGTDLSGLYRDPASLLGHLPGIVLGKVHFPTPPAEFEFTIYAGMAVTALAVLGAVRGFREPGIRFASIFGASALLVAFVRPAALLVQAIPFLGLSPPSRWVLVAGFCLVVLCARGLDTKTTWKFPALLGGLAAAFFLVCLAGEKLFSLSNGAALDTLIGFGLAAAAALASFAARRAAPALWTGAILYELLPFFLHFNFHVDPAVLDNPPPPVVRARERGGGRGTGVLGSASVNREGRLTGDTIGGNSVLTLYGVDNPAGFEAIVPKPYMKYAVAAGAVTESTGRIIVFTRFDSPLLNTAGLRHVFAPTGLPLPGRYRPVGIWGRVVLFENTAALPRARIVGDAVNVFSSDEALRLLASPRHDPRRAAILEAPVPLGSDPLESNVDWTLESSDRLRLKVSCSRDALLVLADTDYPGWEANVDGRPEPILRADGAFRAVRVPQGKRTVEFVFRPASARFGLIASLLSLLLAFGALAVLKRPFRS